MARETSDHARAAYPPAEFPDTDRRERFLAA